MNVKKILEGKAKRDRETLLTESDEIFFDDLKHRVENNSMNRKRSHLRVWVSSMIGATAMILLIVSALVFFLTPNKEVEYLESNFEHLESSVEEIESSLQDFSLTIDVTLYTCNVVKVRDQVSGDALYFILRLQRFDELQSMEIAFVTNEKYHYNASLPTDNLIKVDNSNYSFFYHTDKTIDEEFGLEVLHVKAELHKGKEYIYVLNYAEYLFDPEGTFIDTIQGMIR